MPWTRDQMAERASTVNGLTDLDLNYPDHVGEDAAGKTVAPEQSLQTRSHGRIPLVSAGADLQRIARMIVEHRERMTASRADGEVALEVHLPQLVGMRPLKASIRPGMFGRSLLALGDSAPCRLHEILAALEDAGVAGRTLVVFTSDNGGVRHSSMGGLAGHKQHRRQCKA